MHFAIGEALALSPGDVFGNAAAFFLRQRGHNGDEQFTTFGTPISVTADSTDVNLYAKFVPVCYVYFMDGTGSDARIIATEMLTPEGSLSSEDFDRAALLVPVGAEQAVIGWTKDDEQVGEVSYVEGGSIYLYPIIANGHWITFDSKGGSYVDPQFVTDTTEEPTAPTKSGYDFAGWYDGDTKFDFTTRIAKDYTLTAKYEQISTGKKNCKKSSLAVILASTLLLSSCLVIFRKKK